MKSLLPISKAISVWALLIVSHLSLPVVAASPLNGEVQNDASQEQLQGGTQSGSSRGLKAGVGKGSSTPLKGQIHATGSVLPAAKLHMTQAELTAATSQYASDLKEFYSNAKEYKSSADALKEQIGTCTENEQQWQSKLEKDKLNINKIVIPIGIANLPKTPPSTPPDIPPPRVCCAKCLITGQCGHLGTGGGGGPAAQLSKADSLREQQAGVSLAKMQGKVKIAEEENGLTSQKAINEAQIEESQQTLAEKFGRLKEQYDMLKIEKQALTGIRVQ